MKNKAANITHRASPSSPLRTVLTLILMTAMSVFYFSPLGVRAAAGDLDPSFGVGGKVLTDVPAYTSETGSDVAVQPDGKIIVVGSAVSSTNGTSDFVVLRYNSDGSLDTSFGVDGKVLTDFSNSNDQGSAVALQVDGRIIVAGSASTSDLPLTFAVARYNLNGDLDPSFGIAGRKTVIFSRNSKKSGGTIPSRVWDIAIQFDGMIVLAGDADAKVGIARLNPDSSLDPDFGVNGKVIVSLAVTGGSAAYSVAIQTIDSEQRIVGAGYAATRKGLIDFGLIRLRANGTLDNSFDSDGKVTTDFAGGEDSARDVVIDSSNRIVAAGTCGSVNFALARYNTNGTLDSSFDGDGKVATDFSGFPDAGDSVALQPDGKIIVAGVARNLSNSDFAIARYNSDGTPDSSFGNNGKLTTDFSGLHDSARALAMQPDNRIVLVGTTFNTSVGNNFALARYVLD